MVSIHAPVRGATHGAVVQIAVITCFNPRAREGRDRPGLPGGRRARRFNPRAREGRDEIAGGVDAAEDVSIHAPVRGATVRAQGDKTGFVVSIHAPVRGATGHPADSGDV